MLDKTLVKLFDLEYETLDKFMEIDWEGLENNLHQSIPSITEHEFNILMQVLKHDLPVKLKFNEVKVKSRNMEIDIFAPYTDQWECRIKGISSLAFGEIEIPTLNHGVTKPLEIKASLRVGLINAPEGLGFIEALNWEG